MRTDSEDAMKTTIIGSLGAMLLLLLAAASSAGDLRVDLRKPWARPGKKIKARVEWVFANGGVQGRFPVRWYLTDREGRTVASGAKTARFGWNPPYRFGIRARVPKRIDFEDLRLHVAIVEDEGDDGRVTAIWASGSAPVFVYRKGLRVDRNRETMTGTLLGDGLSMPRLVPEGASVEVLSYDLYGSDISKILANPARDGARVTVTGRHASIPGIGHLPMGPFPFVVDEVTFVDPLPETLMRSRDTEGHLAARIAPVELIGELAWRSLLRSTRTPRIARTREEFDTLNAEMDEGHDHEKAPLDSLAHAEFGEEAVVAVFAGLSPTRDYRVQITSVRYDEATETTWVAYVVFAPREKETGYAEWVEPYVAVIIPARPGRIEFVRTELIPDRPAWW
jgi:hypothetical protein